MSPLSRATAYSRAGLEAPEELAGAAPSEQRVLCAHCGRQFAPDSLTKHEKVCQAARQGSERRGVFNAATPASRKPPPTSRKRWLSRSKLRAGLAPSTSSSANVRAAPAPRLASPDVAAALLLSPTLEAFAVDLDADAGSWLMSPATAGLEAEAGADAAWCGQSPPSEGQELEA